MSTQIKTRQSIINQNVLRTFSVAASVAIFSFITLQSFSQSNQGAVKTGYAPINGLKMYYEIHGVGQPTILIHGGLGSTEMFGSNLNELAKNREVIVMDLQAHGRTADIDRPLSFEFMADDIAELLKYLKIQKADIVGYSIGGCVAIQTVIRHPEMVRKVVAISCSFNRSGFYPEIAAQQAQMGPQTAEMLKQLPPYQSYAKIAPKPQDWPVLIAKLGRLITKEYDYSNDIKNIKAPVMLVFGDADLIMPSHAVAFFALLGGGQRDGNWDGSGISNARLAILPGVTHYNIFMSPALVATVIPYLDQPEKNK